MLSQRVSKIISAPYIFRACTLLLSLFVWSQFLFVEQSFAEGSKQLTPAATDKGSIQIFDQNNINRSFATYVAPPERRLNISICNLGEKIYYGFRGNNDVYYRIKDPAGNIVVGPALLPAAGAGRINAHAEVVAGPQQLGAAGGYNALVYTPAMTGDYYIEFNPVDPVIVNAVNRSFQLFDITVASAANVAIDGRLWSKAWDLNCLGALNPFVATLFVYTNDGIVTSLDFNGMQPHGFIISCNSTGPTNTGNPVTDRKSVPNNNVTYPEYKLFLNNPDPSCFPTGVIGQFTAPTTISGCVADSFCINISVNKPGNAEVLLDLNGVPGYQAGSADRKLSATLIAGTNCVMWNGKDGLGNVVPTGTSVKIQINYLNGLTHLPLYDVENHPNGYIVKSVRPLTPDPPLFWDDSAINNGTTQVAGCASASGCHAWPGNDFGNLNTINTWWYTSIISDSVSTNVSLTAVEAGPTQSVCANAVLLNGTVTNAAKSFWSGGQGTFSPDSSSLTATYTPSAAEITAGSVTLQLNGVGNGTCDTVTDQVIINLSVAPVITISGTDPGCGANDGQASASVSGGGTFTYSWNTNPVQTTSSITGLADGKYKVIVTNAQGCTSTDSVTLVVTSSNPVDAGRDTAICQGSTVTLTATGAGPFLWSTGDITASINVTPSLTATYTVTVNNGACSVKDSVKVIVNTLPNVNLRDTSICIGSNVTLDAGTGFSSYAWSDGSVNQTLTVSSDTIWVKVTNAQGCTKTDTAIVIANPLPAVDLGKDTATCGANSLTLDAGAGFDGYLWSNNAVTQTISVASGGKYWVRVTDLGCVNSDTINITIKPFPTLQLRDTSICIGSNVTLDAGAGFSSYAWSNGSVNQTLTVSSGTIWVKVTNAQGCTKTDTAVVTLNPLPAVELGKDTVLCGANSLTLNAGPGFDAYAWSNSTITQTTVINSAGKYWVRVTDLGCVNSDTINITIKPFPTLQLRDTSFCAGDSVKLDGGTGFTNYLWSTNETTQSIEASSADSYWLKVSDAGCSATDTLIVSMRPYPVLTLQDVSACTGETTVLDAKNSGSTYLWSNGATTQTISVATTGIYWVTVNNGGCKKTGSAKVIYLPPPVVNLGNDSTLCTKQPFILNAGNNGAAYLWSTGATTQSISVFATGSYAVKVTAGNCSESDTLNITYESALDLGPDVSLCNKTEYVLNPGTNPGAQYQWSTGETSQWIKVYSSGTYWVNAVSAACAASDTIEITGEIGFPTLYIPNSFTPNGDNRNESFTGYGENITEFKLQVFSRWGELYFETDDMKKGWDGTYRGTSNIVQEDVYVYIIKYKAACGIEEKTVRKLGHVSVIR